MASVDIVGVGKSYGPQRVLQGIDITIPDGEFVVLVGPSGCGKSSLLRMVAGLEEITEGTISVGGRVVNHVPPKQRDIAMVFQNYALYPHMTVRENMAFSLKLRGAGRAEIDQGVSRAAEILGLQSLLDRHPRQLSGGQRQRVAMGRAIVRQPQVFLFDEPLSNLDAQLRVSMRGEIKALHQRLGITAIYVTHDQLEAMTMADRIVVLNAGRVEQVGRPLELYDRPINRFVAGFIGSPAMNFIAGRLVSEGGASYVESAGIKLPLLRRPDCREGQALIYGIRPEHLALAGASPALPAIVDVVEPTGASTYVSARVAATPISAVIAERRSPAPGTTLELFPQLDHVHLFDQETGRRLG
jgi:multiple sugar transport system ATP-binding protein